MRVLLELDGVIEDCTKNGLQLSWWTLVLDIQKVPPQGSSSVPAESVLVFYCNVRGYSGLILSGHFDSFLEGQFGAAEVSIFNPKFYPNVQPSEESNGDGLTER